MKLIDRIRYVASPRILDLQPYKVESSKYLVKLDAMENPHELPLGLREKWLALLNKTAMNRYPDPVCSELRSRLRQAMSLDPSVNMLFGNGSDEIINLLSLVASGGEGGSVLFPEPTFTVYRLSAEAHGLKVIGVPSSNEDFSCDMENMLDVIQEKQPSLIFLASPNNPTGNSVGQESIIRLCAAADGLVILDEAYCKFAAVSHLKLLSDIDNLLIMQTFSKIGFAGIRLGVLFGATDWIELLDRVRMPYNVNSLTQTTAAFAIDHWEHFQSIIDGIIAERERMMQFMVGLEPITVWPSDGNFILFRTNSMTSEYVHEELQNRDILIKNMSGAHPALLNCLRVTIGKEEENTLFRDSLIEIIGR